MARFPSHCLICLKRLQAGNEESQGAVFCANHSEMLTGWWTRNKLRKLRRRDSWHVSIISLSLCCSGQREWMAAEWERVLSCNMFTVKAQE